MHHEFVKYLEKLISFESVTPSSAGSIEYIESVLKDHGFSTEIQIFGDDRYQVKNLYAIHGSGSPNICFAGHVDVVPAGDLSLWKSDPFLAHINDNKIYGRGAVDMKGALACMMSASLNFIKTNQNRKGSISFLITSDEEGEAKFGTKPMLDYLKSKGEIIDLVILGEPTSEIEIGDTIKIGRRGSINFSLIVEGKQGHVAYPEEADNPISHIVNILYDLINIPIDAGSEFFQATNLEVTSIDVSNDISNVIPAKASAKFNVRFNDLHSKDSIVKLIKSIIENHTKKYELTSVCSAESFIQNPNGLIEDFMKILKTFTKSQLKLSTYGGTSDARFIKDYFPVVELGLTSKMAHKINEYVKISDLQRMHNVYYYTLSEFLGG